MNRGGVACVKSRITDRHRLPAAAQRKPRATQRRLGPDDSGGHLIARPVDRAPADRSHAVDSGHCLELFTGSRPFSGGLDDQDARLGLLEYDFEPQFSHGGRRLGRLLGTEELDRVGVGQQLRPRQCRRGLPMFDALEDRGREPGPVGQVPDPADIRQGGDLRERLVIGTNHIREVAVELTRVTPSAADTGEPLVLDGTDELDEVMVRPGGQFRSPSVGGMRTGGAQLVHPGRRRVYGAAGDLNLVLIGYVLHEIVACEPLAL